MLEQIVVAGDDRLGAGSPGQSDEMSSPGSRRVAAGSVGRASVEASLPHDPNK
jgi:hypothetical protein